MKNGRKDRNTKIIRELMRLMKKFAWELKRICKAIGASSR